MGAHGHFEFKNQPWSPTGGWNFTPKNWRSNLLYITVGMTAIAFVGYKFGEAIKVKSNDEVSDETIARWNAAAKKSRESAAISQAAGDA